MDYLQNDPDYEKYQECKRFVKEFERKISQQKFAELPMWKKADLELIGAACISLKYRKEASKHNCNRELYDQMKECGIRKYNTAMAILKELPEKELKLFWESQVRNKNATCFEELITKREYGFDKSNQLGPFYVYEIDGSRD
jgi:hypothetical protein